MDGYWNNQTRSTSQMGYLRSVASLVVLFCFSTVTCFGMPSSKSKRSNDQRRLPQVAIPFKLYEGYLIVVKASVDGRSEVNVILDTGTSPTVISRELADGLGLRGSRELLLTINGTLKIDRVFLTRVQIGSLTVRSLNVAVEDLQFLRTRLNIDVGAIIGLDVLGSANFTIDYAKHLVSFGRAATAKSSARLETAASSLIVNATVDGQPVRLLVDTGSSGLLVYRKSLGLAMRTPSGRAVEIRTGSGTSSGRYVLASHISIGDTSLGAKFIIVADSESTEDDLDGLLGLAQIGFSMVSFDFANARMLWK